MRRLILLLLFALPCWAQTKPNVVFLLVDDLGWHDLGVYGADLHETPNIDRFAQTAVRFTQAYAASPVCSPTRASILTGKHPARLHLTIWREAAHHPPLDRKLVPPTTMDHLPLEETTLAEVFKKNGYVTAHVGKWHLGTAEYYPQTQGFDYNIGGTLWGAPQTFFFPYSGDRYFSEPRYVPHLEDGKPGENLTDRLADEAIKILERHRVDPLYLQLWFHAVHTPIEGKPEIAKRYQAKITPGMRHRNAQYAAMVETLDQNVGRVLAKLDELGLADNTIVFLTSDNGGFINPFQGEAVTNNSPLRSGKGSAYEGGVRVPLMVRAPGVTKAGGVSDEPVMSTDYYPTILSLAGLSDEEGHRPDGVNISSLLRDPQAKLGREALFFHYPHYYPTTSPVSAVRVGYWKLLHYYEDGHNELYNLDDDLGESKDLAKAETGRVRDMAARLMQWLESVDAQTPSAH